MRKFSVTEFITLDGVIEDPGGAEKFERGGWAFQFERGPEGDKFKMDVAKARFRLGARACHGDCAYPAISYDTQAKHR
jgi:hypothetical protein